MNEVTEKLLQLREAKVRELMRYQNMLEAVECELKSIDEQICNVNGHNFTSWTLKQSPILDKECYLERKCTVCGRREITDDQEMLNSYSVRLHSIK